MDTDGMARLRVRKQLVRSCRGLTLTALFFLEACAPAFPVLKSESELTLPLVQRDASGDARGATSTPKVDLPCVLNDAGEPAKPMNCLQAAHDELVRLQNRAGGYERAMGFAAVAGGSYAGYQATRTHVNHALLKHAAVGLATLVGINQVVDAEGQMSAISVGIDALNCVRQAAETVESTKDQILEAQTHDFSGIVRQEISDVASDKAFTAATFAAMVSTTRAAEVSARSVAYISSAKSAQRFAPRAIYGAVVAIRQQVRKSIVGKSVNLKDIYDAQRKAVASMVGDLAAKEKSQQDAVNVLGLSGSDTTKVPTVGSTAQQTLAVCGIPGTGS